MELLQWMNAGSSPDGSGGFVADFTVVSLVEVVVAPLVVVIEELLVVVVVALVVVVEVVVVVVVVVVVTAVVASVEVVVSPLAPLAPKAIAGRETAEGLRDKLLDYTFYFESNHLIATKCPFEKGTA